MSPAKRITYSVAFALLVIGTAVFYFGWLDRLENISYSWRVNTFLDRQKPSDEIVLILLDQKSLEWGAQEQGWEWPWPRSIYGYLIDHLQEKKAKSIILDLLFTEASPYPGEDEKLAKAIEGDVPVYTAVSIRSRLDSGKSAWEEAGARPYGLKNASKSTTSTRCIFPVKTIASSNVKYGDVMGEVDLESEIKSLRPFRYFDGYEVPFLGLSPFVNEEHMTSFKDTPELLLNFRGKSMSHKHVSFGQVLQDILLLNNGEEEVLPEAFFSNKHVFVGFSAPGLKDLRKTPVDDIFAGVEIHATALDNYLNNDFIHKASPFWTMCLLIVITVIFIFTTFTKKIYIRILLAASMVLFPIACGVFSYMVEIWLQMAVPIVMAVVSVICSFLIAIIFESRQKRFIRNAFSKYLSRDVVNKMLDNPDLLKLGGERKELTIMFSDLAGFSSISEKMDPEQLTSLLNDYLSEMSDIIMEEGGTLDKYEGDAIMAFWGAPLEMKDHATRACTAAIKYQKTLKEKSSEWKAKYGVDLKARIGIHTGTVIVGNMGSKTRFDYTVLGDAANLASRLEGANKQFESSVMVSDVTKEKCDQGIYFRTIAPITVVGRNEELWVYEPIGFEQEDLRPWQKWEDAMDMFKNKGFYKTAKYMEENFEETKEVKLYLDKMSNRAWDGVFRLDQK